jgi:hypothetical protein
VTEFLQIQKCCDLFGLQGIEIASWETEEDWKKPVQEAIGLLALWNTPLENDKMKPVRKQMRKRKLQAIRTVSSEALMNTLQIAESASQELFTSDSLELMKLSENTFLPFENLHWQYGELSRYCKKVDTAYNVLNSIVGEVKWATARNKANCLCAKAVKKLLEEIGIIVYASVPDPRKLTDIEKRFYSQVFPADFNSWRGRLSTQKFGI